MAKTIWDDEIEALARDVARLAGENLRAAVQRALLERKARLAALSARISMGFQAPGAAKMLRGGNRTRRVLLPDEVRELLSFGPKSSGGI